MPVLRESLTMDVIQSINKSICWNKIFDGIGSRQQDLHGEKRMISLTILHDIGKFFMVVALAYLQMTTVLSYSSPRTWSWQSRYPFSDNRGAFLSQIRQSN